jgi:crotonobetainyl-CoA:carnitine CoA-transferase CaiB-like acyl-CoA transferase
VLKSVNPEVVLLSMPAFGTTGPWSAFRAYGSTVEHASGLPHLNGRPEDPPTMLHVAYGDAVGGINGAICLLTALRHRLTTGKGQFCDLSQVEGLLPFAMHGILEQAVHHRPLARQGNTHPSLSPHGVYRCAGTDAWIVLQVTCETQWTALRALAAPQLDSFGDLEDRLQRRLELDQAINQWTATQDPDVLMFQLQSAGVTAAQVSSAEKVMFDPHLESRGFWQFMERAVVGMQPNPSAPWRRVNADGSTTPEESRHPAPTLGQHNAEVLQGELQMPRKRYEELQARGIIGEIPRMPGTIRRF